VTAPSRWNLAGYATCACTAVGTAFLLAGREYHRPGLALLGVVLDGASAGSIAVLVYAWVRWHLAHGAQACLIYKLGPRGRVRHQHWPKDKITGCDNVIGFHAHLRKRL
jgi:hypothetical protein